MITAIALVLIGFFLLVWSADLLVDNASEFAHQVGVSTFIVGIIIVGFGTSAPEMFVSAMAALENKGNLALGNALGSNITNIGLVLGSAAMVRALPVTQTTARIDIPIVIVTGAVAIYMVLDGLLSNMDGVILLALLFSYLAWSAGHSKGAGGEPAISDIVADPHELDLSRIDHPRGKSAGSALLFTLFSIILLMIASKMLVQGAITIAIYLGVGELIIGLTIVAVGTSLPELAAAISAARKGVHDMIIGNIIGSNIFNTLGVLGITGVIRATEIDTGALWRDFPVMFVFTIFMFIFALTKGNFSRGEGTILVIGYFGYIGYLVVTSLI
ncbi:MAG: calcium/sodium antiporter [Gammaproteobacteria bacterium]|nr:calcium/sodium antiporter [Gammaproteobacteria bacterium]